MSKRLLIPLSVVVVLVVALVVVKELLAPKMIRAKMLSALEEACPQCETSLGPVRLHLFPPGLTVRDFHMMGGEPHSTLVTADVPYAFAEVAIWPYLRHGTVRVTNAHLDGVKVLIGEGLKYIPPTSHGGPPPITDVELDGIKITHAELSYAHEQPPEPEARLDVHDIDARIGPFGLTKRLHDETVRGEATGRLEKSGRFSIVILATPFVRPPDVDVDLILRKQNLSDVNRFFRHDDGIELKGELVEGHGKVVLRGGNKLTAKVTATYHGLDVAVRSNRERSGLSAFVQNLVASIKIDEKNTDLKKGDRVRSVEIARELPRESLVSFILRGLKDAALKVASGEHRRR